MDRSSLCPFRPGKKERPLFQSFPVLTTARAGALKWRDPRCQCASIEIAKTRKTSPDVAEKRINSCVSSSSFLHGHASNHVKNTLTNHPHPAPHLLSHLHPPADR